MWGEKEGEGKCKGGKCVNPYFKVVNNAATAAAAAAQGAQMQNTTRLDYSHIRERLAESGRGRSAGGGEQSSVLSWRHILIHASGANTHTQVPRGRRGQTGAGAKWSTLDAPLKDAMRRALCAPTWDRIYCRFRLQLEIEKQTSR